VTLKMGWKKRKEADGQFVNRKVGSIRITTRSPHLACCAPAGRDVMVDDAMGRRQTVIVQPQHIGVKVASQTCGGVWGVGRFSIWGRGFLVGWGLQSEARTHSRSFKA